MRSSLRREKTTILPKSNPKQRLSLQKSPESHKGFGAAFLPLDGGFIQTNTHRPVFCILYTLYFLCFNFVVL